MHPSLDDSFQFCRFDFTWITLHTMVTSKCTDVTAFHRCHIEIDRALGLFQFVAFDMLSLVRLYVLIIWLTRYLRGGTSVTGCFLLVLRGIDSWRSGLVLFSKVIFWFWWIVTKFDPLDHDHILQVRNAVWKPRKQLFCGFCNRALEKNIESWFVEHSG